MLNNNVLKLIADQLVGFEYIVWKDIGEVISILDNGSNKLELDVVVKRKQLELFMKRLESIGFGLYKTRIPRYKESIYHAFRFFDGGYIHFHIYPKLITGSHYSKEYSLDFKIPFDEFYLHNGFKMASRDIEMFFSALRCSLKRGRGNLETLKNSDLGNEFDFISDPKGKYFDEYKNILASKDAFRYKSKLVVYIESLYYRCLHRAHCKIFDVSNKESIVSKQIAIVGIDGSGKTTLSNMLFGNVKKKTPYKKVYLGSNGRNFSIITWMKYFMFKLFFRFFNLVKLQKIYVYGLAEFEISRLNDTYKRYVKSQKFRGRGFNIIYERFPMPGFLDFPNKLEEKFDRYLLGRQKSRLEVLKSFWLAESESTRIFLIRTSLDDIKKRRPIKGLELRDICEKKSVEANFLAGGGGSSNVVVIENNRNIGEVLDSIYEKM